MTVVALSEQVAVVAAARVDLAPKEMCRKIRDFSHQTYKSGRIA
ncbi:hypothetical protein ABZ079_00665 [Streptomyces sp. NPDC006314]